MEKKELFRKELYRVCRLCDFLPPKFLEDSLVFWVSQELSKAREEGFRDALAEVQKRVGIEDAKVYVLCNVILQEELLCEHTI